MCRECRKQLGSEYAVVLGGHAQLARHACDFRIVVVVVSTQEVLFVEQFLVLCISSRCSDGESFFYSDHDQTDLT